MITRRSDSLSSDMAYALSLSSTLEQVEAENIKTSTIIQPWSGGCGVGRSVAQETWYVHSDYLAPYVSEDGTLVGMWVGPVGYFTQKAGESARGAHKSLTHAVAKTGWEWLPSSPGADPLRWFVALGHLPADPGRRARIEVQLNAESKAWGTFYSKDLIPLRLELGYTVADPADDWAVWHIMPECPLGGALSSMQRTMIMDVLASSQVVGYGLCNTTVPPMALVMA